MKTNIYTLLAHKCAYISACSVSGDRLSVMRIRIHIHAYVHPLLSAHALIIFC